MKKKVSTEIYLISFALLLSGIIILYNVFTAPALDFPRIDYQESTPTDSAALIPSESKPMSDTESSAPVSSVSVSDEKVNINTAGAEELSAKLSGIGAVKASAILEYREENGRFKKIEDIMKVKGVGEKTFDKIKSNISVE